MTYKNVCDTAKAVIRVKFIGIRAYNRKRQVVSNE